MSNEAVRELTLRQLLEDNFKSSKRLRKFTEALEEASLKSYFQKLASRRSQFAIEISEEIYFFSGKKPFIPSVSYPRKMESNCQENKMKCIKKALKANKNSLLKYQEALCRIHDGSCREVLIRHKAYIENCIFELKSLKTLLRYVVPKEEELDEIRSNS
ncbi:hypothetical protein [Salinimicrobium sediminilitoris]|uniref:hypothetical protein n=1 Tax=Salinimicrobium sediminilitoris TaxID=2876715 RepID=UPI001E2FA7AC|nr:hypothetical protein [Salinimicrobium sediminilitoris]MCC8358391.1 hypothetical protein [Salinimicrobium sediminilitoris]